MTMMSANSSSPDVAPREAIDARGADDIEWIDGDQPRSTTFGDTYFSRDDGQAETRHVFLEGNDLPPRLGQCRHFRVSELGFGTGLNVLETWRLWQDIRRCDAMLDILSVEAHPLACADIRRALSRWPDLAEPLEAMLAVYTDAFDRPVHLDEQTRLRIVEGDALEILSKPGEAADAWFLDGFSPDRNPDLWSQDLMNAVAARTEQGGTFATYTAAGWVRRNLIAAGFVVEKSSGFGRKREMMRGHIPARGEAP